MIVALTSLGIDTEKQLSVSDLSSGFKKYFLKKTDVLKSKDYVLIVYDARSIAQIANTSRAQSSINPMANKLLNLSIASAKAE